MSIRWQIHISASFLLAFYMMTGRFADYVVIVVSLLIHEAGHLLAARLVRVEVDKVCFYLHGADLRFKTNFIAPKQQFVIACGGLIATCSLFIVCLLVRHEMLAPVMEMQKLLLLVNLCPIWPLDGGRIVQVVLAAIFSSNDIELSFLKLSFLVAVTVVLFGLFLSKLFVVLVSIVICQQLAVEIKQFPLRNAYKKLVLNNK